MSARYRNCDSRSQWICSGCGNPRFSYCSCPKERRNGDDDLSCGPFALILIPFIPMFLVLWVSWNVISFIFELIVDCCAKRQRRAPVIVDAPPANAAEDAPANAAEDAPANAAEDAPAIAAEIVPLANAAVNAPMTNAATEYHKNNILMIIGSFCIFGVPIGIIVTIGLLIRHVCFRKNENAD